MIKKFYIAVVAVLVSATAFAQNFKIVDSLSSRIELDDDSLYYDDAAYLDDYHFHDNIFIGASAGVTHSMSENTRFDSSRMTCQTSISG